MIGYKNIKMNDKDYSYKYTLEAKSLFEKASRNKERPKGLTFFQLDRDMKINEAYVEDVLLMIYCGLKVGSKKDKKELDISLSELTDFLNENENIYNQLAFEIIGIDFELAKSSFKELDSFEDAVKELTEDDKKKLEMLKIFGLLGIV